MRDIARRRRSTEKVRSAALTARINPATGTPQYGNRILDQLPPTELERIAPDLQAVTVRVRQSMVAPQTSIEKIYFPVTFVASAITEMRDGSAVEIGTIGREGVVGIDALLGGESMPNQIFAQVRGDGFCISRSDFVKHAIGNPIFDGLLCRYARVFGYAVAQSVACNRLHSLPQRCARWLLMTHDRVGHDTFYLTQEFLAYMLGVHRPSVSVVASELQKLHLMDYRRGKITILDRLGLENASCECYEVNVRQYEEIMSSGQLHPRSM